MSLTRKVVSSASVRCGLRLLSTEAATQTATEQKAVERRICPNRFRGKVVLVTGSTEGIGLASAERFCQEGAFVVVNGRRPKLVNHVVDQLKDRGFSASGFPGDVGIDEQRDALIEKIEKDHGGVDVFMSNVGANFSLTKILKCPKDVWEKTMDVNLRSAFLMTQKLVPHMLKKETPCSILYTSSYVAYEPQGSVLAYGVSKTALLAMARAWAENLATTNIRVNCIAPGLVNTKMTAPVKRPDRPLSKKEEMQIKMMEIVAKEVNHFAQRIPMKRSAEPHEIAAAAAFLCSTDASYITGENVGVGGGLHTRI